MAAVPPSPKASTTDVENGTAKQRRSLDGITISGDLEAGATDTEEKRPVVEDSLEDDQDQPDPDIVTWDGPDDPQNPMNWPDKKKWFNIAVLSILTIIT